LRHIKDLSISTSNDLRHLHVAFHVKDNALEHGLAGLLSSAGIGRDERDYFLGPRPSSGHALCQVELKIVYITNVIILFFLALLVSGK